MSSSFEWGVIISQVVGFIISLLSCSLFSFLETSITALRPYRIEQLFSSTKKYRSLLSLLEHNPHQILITMLIANSLANVTAAALSTSIMEELGKFFNISSGVGFSLGVGLGACTILIFGEIIPKSIAKLYGERLMISTLWITNTTFYVLYPLVIVLMKISDFFIQQAGASSEEQENIAEPEIRYLIAHGDQTGALEKDKSNMLQSIFKICYKSVREIMKSWVDVIMINSSSSIQEALEIFSQYQFSRLPVYEHDSDNIIGMIYQKDIFGLINAPSRAATLKELVRPILFVPESMKVNQLLNKFKEQYMHLAMVTNEFGSITGLVTLEDVLEEIVGEIRDEHEVTNKKIVALSEIEWLVDASIDFESLQEICPIDFEATMAATLGGFLTERLEHLPIQGESLSYKGYYFTVQHASHKRVIQVLIQKKD